MNSFGPTMSTASSSVVYDQFPAGLRVLVVDDDPTCLLILEKMLRTCLYEVTKCSQAETALSLLRENHNGYDIVLSDVHMPDMDGFKLLEHIGLEMDLPVIMMSADDGKDVVMKGVTHGACDYLIKPVRIEALKNIWQHVIRKRKNEWKDYDQTGSAEEGDSRQDKQAEDAEYSSSANEGNWKSTKRRKDDEEETDEQDDTSTLKKPRVVWSVELHQQFVAAVNQLGIDKAVPKKILELMNVPGLTRENVASHLQKYRLYLRRLSGVSQHHNEINNSFIHPQEARKDPLSSFNTLDIQTLVAANQLPAQSLANLQAAGLGRPMSNPRIPMHVVDQRNLFRYESQKMRYLDGQQQRGLQQHLGSNNRLNLLQGIPASMAPKQLVYLHQPAQSLVGMNLPANAHGVQGNQSTSSLLMQTSLPHSGAEILNEMTSNHIPGLPSSVGHFGKVLSRNQVGAGLAGHNAASQSMNYPLNKPSEFTGNSFALGNTSGMYNHTSKEPIPQAISSEMKGTGGLLPSYNIFSDLHQHKPPELQNLGSTFAGSHQVNALQRNLNIGPSLLDHEGYYSAVDIMDRVNIETSGQPMFAKSSIKVKTERAPIQNSPNMFFEEQFGQDDLMSAILAQQEGGIRQAEPDFDFDAYNIDNILV